MANYLPSLHWDINLMSRVFANGMGDRDSILDSHIKDSKNSTWYCLA